MYVHTGHTWAYACPQVRLSAEQAVGSPWSGARNILVAMRYVNCCFLLAAAWVGNPACMLLCIYSCLQARQAPVYA